MPAPTSPGAVRAVQTAAGDSARRGLVGPTILRVTFCACLCGLPIPVPLDRAQSVWDPSTGGTGLGDGGRRADPGLSSACLALARSTWAFHASSM